MQTPEPRTPSQYWKWFLLSYVPRLIGSLIWRRSPIVNAYGSKPGSRFIAELSRVNLVRPTRLCRVMTWYGSDKGRRWHNYTAVYSVLFANRGSGPRIFELGLGTNNPALVSTMGSTGRPGASLHGWRDYFPDAAIFGADIDRAILFESNGIKTFYCDQTDAAAIESLWAQPDLAEGMDILIEDGLHTYNANISFLHGSLAHVRPGGTYVIEDIGTETLSRWRAMLPAFAQSRPAFEFALLELPNPVNQQDNNLLAIRRHA